MSSSGFHKWDNDGNLIPEEHSNISDDFGANIDSRVSFKYTFLAPEVSEDNRKTKMSTKDAEKHTKPLSLKPEMNVLLAISESKNLDIRQLIQHPVIKSYTWLKWKLIRTYFNRNLRIRTLLAICLTWFIFSYYGGAVWNSNKLYRKITGVRSKEQLEPKQFCNNDPFSFKSLSDLGNNRYSKDWYILFAFHAFFQILCIILDMKTLITARYYSNKYLVQKGSNQSLFMACGLDIFTFVLIVIVLIGAEGILWFVITVLLVYQCAKEYVQIVSSFPDYLFHLDNYFDMAQIATICFLLYYPNYLEDTNAFSINTEEDDAHRWASECRVKRSLAAFTILFTFVRLLMSIARHPYLERCSIYFMMFYRVTGSFMKFLSWYSSFIIAFGLGFYILFHDDTKRQTVANNAKNVTLDVASSFSTIELHGTYILRNVTDKINGSENVSIIFSNPSGKKNEEENETEETRFDVP